MPEHRCPRPWAENVYPTPAQLLEYLDTACEECRLRMAEAAINDAGRAARCLLHHPPLTGVNAAS